MDGFKSDITFDEAFYQNYSLMLKYCNRRLNPNISEDIVSEAFVLLYTKWDTLVSHQEKLITAWIYKVLRLKCMEYRREIYSRKNTIDLNYVLDGSVYLDNISPFFEEYNYLYYINAIQKKLSEIERTVFDCIIVKEMSVADTAKHLNISQNNVRVRLSRTKTHIRSFIDSLIQS